MTCIIYYKNGTFHVSETVSSLDEHHRRGLLLYDDEHNDQRGDDGTLSGRPGPLVLTDVVKIEVIP